MLRFLIPKTKGVITRAPLKIDAGSKIPADFIPLKRIKFLKRVKTLIRALIKINTPDQISRQVSYLRFLPAFGN